MLNSLMWSSISLFFSVMALVAAFWNFFMCCRWTARWPKKTLERVLHPSCSLLCLSRTSVIACSMLTSSVLRLRTLKARSISLAIFSLASRAREADLSRWLTLSSKALRGSLELTKPEVATGLSCIGLAAPSWWTAVLLMTLFSSMKHSIWSERSSANVSSFSERLFSHSTQCSVSFSCCCQLSRAHWERKQSSCESSFLVSSDSLTFWANSR